MDFKTRKIDLFGTVYTIKYVDDLIDMGNGNMAIGTTDHVKHTILVSKSSDGDPLPENEIKLTLYHELMHAIFHTGQYLDDNADEPIVEWCARCIYQCVKKGIL